MLVSCSGKNDQQKEADKIMALSREWSKAAGSDSLEKTLSYWSEDAVCLFPDKATIKGKDSIRKMLLGTPPGTVVSWEPGEAHVSEDGDMAYVIARNSFSISDSTGKITTIFNKSIEIWRRQKDGTWKCVVDMYNSDPTIKSLR